jgi:hypothetical protein
MSKANRPAFWLTGLGLAAVLMLATPRAVHAVVAALVQVTNTTANPVITSRMDDPGRIPYESYVAGDCYTSNLCEFSFSPVPAGHRLVIQHVSIVGAASGPGVVQATLATPIAFSDFFVPTAPTGVVYTFVQDEPVLVSVDPGVSQTLSVGFFGGSAMIKYAQATLSGYMLDCSAAPCSPIAH